MLVKESDLSDTESRLWHQAKESAAAGPTGFRNRLEDRGLQQFFDYWRRLRKNYDAAKSAFDPLEIPALLGHLQIFEILANGRIRVRLSGIHTNEMIGRDVTGQFIEDHIEFNHVKLRYFLFNEVKKRELPLFYTDCVRVGHKDIFWSRRLLTPVYDTAGECRYLYSAVKLYNPSDEEKSAGLIDIVLSSIHDL